MRRRNDGSGSGELLAGVRERAVRPMLEGARADFRNMCRTFVQVVTYYMSNGCNLQAGDQVVFAGQAEREGFGPISSGECAGTVLFAVPWPADPGAGGTSC